MSKTKSQPREVPEPAEDPRDTGPATFFVVGRIYSHWLVYMDGAGNQQFTRRRAEALMRHIQANNRKGWTELRVVGSLVS